MSRCHIVEYEAFPEWGVVNGMYACAWRGKITVDLQWVAAAKLGMTPDATSICLAGSAQWMDIKAAYSDFMRAWMEAKNL